MVLHTNFKYILQSLTLLGDFILHGIVRGSGAEEVVLMKGVLVFSIDLALRFLK